MKRSEFNIGSVRVGEPYPCLLVAEIAQAHDGSLGTAHAYIDSIADAGVDVVKFQTHLASAESTTSEPWRSKFSLQDATRYDYWKRMEFTEEQWMGLANHARQRNLIFLSSPFSMDAVALLDRLEVPAWKVGAGEITNLPMIERMGKTGKPVLLSTGLASWFDLDAAVNCVRQSGAPVAVYQCTSAYPCPPEQLGLNVLDQLRERYDCPIGLSDHSGTIYAGLAAATLKANLIEVHVVFSRECFGPDVCASLTTEELKQLVEGVRFIEKALASEIDKEVMAGNLTELRRMFGKSIVAASDLVAGHRLCENDLALKKPGIGLAPARLPELIGRRLMRALQRDEIIREDDLA